MGIHYRGQRYEVRSETSIYLLSAWLTHEANWTGLRSPATVLQPLSLDSAGCGFHDPVLALLLNQVPERNRHGLQDAPGNGRFAR